MRSDKPRLNDKLHGAKKPFSRWQRLAIFGVATLLLLALGVLVLLRVLDRPRPHSDPTAEADQMARRMMAAVDIPAWRETGAVSWDFAGRQQHLWDRKRQFARVRWQDVEVQIDLASRRGIATEGASRLDEEAAAPLVEKAWSLWCNDSFWLNPIDKLFDDGTERALVDLDDGGQGLLVTYTSGGVTPGDSYLWRADEDGTPQWWRMWTQILPIGGLEASWQDWITLPTGARVATRHHIAILDLELKDVSAASDLAELEGGADPFAPLASYLEVGR